MENNHNNLSNLQITDDGKLIHEDAGKIEVVGVREFQEKLYFSLKQ